MHQPCTNPAPTLHQPCTSGLWAGWQPMAARKRERFEGEKMSDESEGTFRPCGERGRALLGKLRGFGFEALRVAADGHIVLDSGKVPGNGRRAFAAIEAAGGKPNAGRDVELALADVEDHLCSLRVLVKRWKAADWDAVKRGLAGPDGESIAARFRAAEEACRRAARAPAGPGHALTVEGRHDALREAIWTWEEAAQHASGKSEGSWTNEQWARALAVDVASEGVGVDGRPGGVGSLRVVDSQAGAADTARLMDKWAGTLRDLAKGVE
jgi:hypothetical protein